MFPLSGRSTPMLIGCNLAMTAWLILMGGSYQIYCGLYMVSSAVGTVAFIAIYVARVWIFLFRYHWTTSLAAMQQLQPEERANKANAMSETDFFLRHRALTKNRFLFRVFAVFISIYVVIIVVSVASVSEAASRRVCSDELQGVRYFNLSVCLVFVAAAAIFGFMIHRVKVAHKCPDDGLFVIQELKFVSAFFFLFLVGMVVPHLEPVKSIQRKYSVLNLVVVFFVAAFIVVVNMVPLRISYRSHALNMQHSASVSSNSAYTAKEGKLTAAYLQTPSADRDKFFKFLMGEFSTENLLFWWEADSLELQIQHASARGRLSEGSLEFADIKSKISRIYDKFIANNSPLQINIASSVRGRCWEHLQDWGPAGLQEVAMVRTQLQEAKARVHLLMETDSFPRFRRAVPFTPSRPSAPSVSSTTSLSCDDVEVVLQKAARKGRQKSRLASITGFFRRSASASVISAITQQSSHLQMGENGNVTAASNIEWGSRNKASKSVTSSTMSSVRDWVEEEQGGSDRNVQVEPEEKEQKLMVVEPEQEQQDQDQDQEQEQEQEQQDQD